MTKEMICIFDGQPAIERCDNCGADVCSKHVIYREAIWCTDCYMEDYANYYMN